MDYVYHGSPVEGLTCLEPRISTHGNSWVYAAKDKSVALVFLQKWNDFLLSQYIVDGKQELTERLPNIFGDIYKGKRGFIYYLDSANFLEDMTSFSGEVVSDKTEKVLHCEVIEDCYEKLCEMEKNNEIALFRYPNRPHYIPLDDSDLAEQTKYFLEHSKDKKRLIDYVSEKHPNLKNALHLLLEKYICTNENEQEKQT